jgi:DNA-binding transcriptional ArsR family regulator
VPGGRATLPGVSKRNRRPRATSRKRTTSARQRRPRREEPDLIGQIAAALDENDPLPLLGLASALLAAVDPRSRNPFEPPSDGPSRERFVESFLAVPLAETSALLAAVAALSGDEVLRRRVGREIADRSHPLPGWLAGLPRAVSVRDAVEITHVLGDGDDVIVAVALPGGHVLTAVVYIDHNLGTIVKDAFVVADPLDAVVERVRAADDTDIVARKLSPADARVRISDAIEDGAMTFPPCESDTWPACRPLIEWMAALLPAEGTGYRRPEWDDAAVADLTRRFWASPFAADVADPDDLLSSLLWFGTDYGPGDPLRWSPVAVEILLLDWIPRKIVADADHLTGAPDVLRAFVRFCHHERGIRAALTEQTLAAIDAFAPEYQRLIRSDRLQGPQALLAAMGVPVKPEPEDTLSEIMLDSLRRAVGGEAALDGLDADPLPEEPFAWNTVPTDVRERVNEVLGLVDGCCAVLLDEQYRTVCRRLLADAATADPDIFRRRGRAATAAAAICWIAGKANSLFDREPDTLTLQVKQLAEHFGLTGSSVSQRTEPLLRAIGVDARQYGRMDLGTPRYLTGSRRARILALRDHYRAMVE